MASHPRKKLVLATDTGAAVAVAADSSSVSLPLCQPFKYECSDHLCMHAFAYPENNEIIVCGGTFFDDESGKPFAPLREYTIPASVDILALRTLLTVERTEETVKFMLVNSPRSEKEAARLIHSGHIVNALKRLHDLIDGYFVKILDGGVEKMAIAKGKDPQNQENKEFMMRLFEEYIKEYTDAVSESADCNVPHTANSDQVWCTIKNGTELWFSTKFQQLDYDGALWCNPTTHLLRCIIPLALNQTRLKIVVDSKTLAPMFGIANDINIRVRPDNSVAITDPASIPVTESDVMHVISTGDYFAMLFKYHPARDERKERPYRIKYNIPENKQVVRPEKDPNWAFIADQLATYEKVAHVVSASGEIISGVGVKCNLQTGKIATFSDKRMFGGALIPHIKIEGIHSVFEGRGCSDRLFSRLTDHVLTYNKDAIVILPRAPLEVMRRYMMSHGGCMAEDNYSCLPVRREILFSIEAAREIERMCL
jgi:hypothetical protein